MGKKNSSLTRIQPLFDYLGMDINKINKFLSLFEIKTEIKASLFVCKYGYDEASIKPCKELLIWCVNNIDKLNKKEFEALKNETSESAQKRYALFCNNTEIKKEALNELYKDNIPQRAWFIFEGYTHPDVYMETDDSIYIGEAKRTENELTNHTKWLEDRDQLIRHVDSVIDRGKKVYSFFVIENPENYDFNKYFETEIYDKSLPHRNQEIRKKIKNTYIGYTTFSKINEIFNNEIKYRDTTDD